MPFFFPTRCGEHDMGGHGLSSPPPCATHRRALPNVEKLNVKDVTGMRERVHVRVSVRIEELTGPVFRYSCHLGYAAHYATPPAFLLLLSTSEIFKCVCRILPLRPIKISMQIIVSYAHYLPPFSRRLLLIHEIHVGLL